MPNNMPTDRPYPQRIERLPRHLAEITPQWLSGLLQNKYPGVVVERAEAVQVLNSHTTKLRLRLSFNEAGKKTGLPEYVCLKSNWSDGFESGDICEMEARFYHLMHNRLRAPIPKCVYADWDGDGGGRGVVALEDLGSTPGKFGNSTDHLGVDGVAHGLETLARLHAELWGSQELDQPWLRRSMDTTVDTEQLLRGWNYSRLYMGKDSYRKLLPDWLYERPELFAQAFDELAAFEREQPGPYGLVHGDSHQGNSYLRETGERVWLDWQLIRKGHPWRDVLYFLLGSLTIEERRSSGEELIRHYRGALIGHGARDVCSIDRAWDFLRRWTVYGMQSWLSNVDVWGQNGVEMVNRFWTAAEDYESIVLLTKGKKPRREIRLGEGARELSAGVKEMMARGEI